MCAAWYHVRFHCTLDAHAVRRKQNFFDNHTRWYIRSFNTFILCVRDRVLSSAPLKTVVIGEDWSDFWEPKEHSHLQTAVDCIRMDGTDYHLDHVRTGTEMITIIKIL